jgi:hypothetical protein
MTTLGCIENRSPDTPATGWKFILNATAGPDLVEMTDDDTDDRPGEENVTDNGV